MLYVNISISNFINKSFDSNKRIQARNFLEVAIQKPFALFTDDTAQSGTSIARNCTQAHVMRLSFRVWLLHKWATSGKCFLHLKYNQIVKCRALTDLNLVATSSKNWNWKIKVVFNNTLHCSPHSFSVRLVSHGVGQYLRNRLVFIWIIWNFGNIYQYIRGVSFAYPFRKSG